MRINYKLKTDILLDDIGGKMIELIPSNETEVELLQKKLDIAVKALKKYEITETHDWIDSQITAQKALKEIDLVGASPSLADNKM